MRELPVNQGNLLEAISGIFNGCHNAAEMIEKFHFNGKRWIKPGRNWIFVPNGEVTLGGYNLTYLGLNDRSW